MHDFRTDRFLFCRDFRRPGQPLARSRKSQAIDTGRHRDDERDIPIDRCKRLIRKFDSMEARQLLVELQDYLGSDEAVCVWGRQSTTDGRHSRGLLIDQGEWRALRVEFESFKKQHTAAEDCS